MSAPQPLIEKNRIMASTSGLPGFDTPQVQFVLEFFHHLSTRNLDAAFSLLSNNLVYEQWPASLAHAPRTKSEYKVLLDTNPDRDVKVLSLGYDRIHVLAALTRWFQFEILEMIESPGKVVAHVSCRLCPYPVHLLTPPGLGDPSHCVADRRKIFERVLLYLHPRLRRKRVEFDLSHQRNRRF